MTEADRLTRLAPDEWRLWYKKRAQTLGIEHETLRELVEAKLKATKAAERAATAEQHRVEDRAERQRHTAEREEESARKSVSASMSSFASRRTPCSVPKRGKRRLPTSPSCRPLTTRPN
jgi:septal ring factor EnvC (AmiA/AmiB activator)